jgi:hypothetical protein
LTAAEGTSEAVTNLISGRLSLLFAPLPSVETAFKAWRKLRLLTSLRQTETARYAGYAEIVIGHESV